MTESLLFIHKQMRVFWHQSIRFTQHYTGNRKCHTPHKYSFAFIWHLFTEQPHRYLFTPEFHNYSIDYSDLALFIFFFLPYMYHKSDSNHLKMKHDGNKLRSPTCLLEYLCSLSIIKLHILWKLCIWHVNDAVQHEPLGTHTVQL